MSKGPLVLRDVTLARRDGRGVQRLVLQRLEATFEPGQVAVVTGPNGSGKTTLAHLLACILRPTSGTVLAGDEAVSRYTAAHRDVFRRSVGLVMQPPRLIHGFSLRQNMAAPLVPRISHLSDAMDRVDRMIRKLSLSHVDSSPAQELSAGECQRVSLGRALVGRPSYVIADEPTSSQDHSGVQMVRDLLDRCARDDAVVVVTTHDPRLDGWGDVTMKLEDGRLER